MALSVFSTLFRYRDKKSPDKLGLYPTAVHIPAMPERRYLWTSRVLVIVCGLSFSLTIILGSTIYLLLPQRGATPRILQTNQYFSQLEDLQKQEKHIFVDDLITEELIEKYIDLRHSVGAFPYELMSRWAVGSELYWLSSLPAYQTFAAKATQAEVEKIAAQNFTRKTEIEWIKRLTPQLWQVQFSTINTARDSGAKTVMVWRAYLRIIYVDVDEDNLEELHYNPYGFKVKNYSLAYVGKPNEAESYLSIARATAGRGRKNMNASDD